MCAAPSRRGGWGDRNDDPGLLGSPGQPWTSEEGFRRAVRSGDHRAWNELAVRYTGPLVSRAKALLPEGTEPEDAVAQTWLQGLRYAHAYDVSMPPFPWLVMICRRICVADRQRVVRHRPPGQFTPRRVRCAAPDEATIRRNALRRALADLTPSDRNALTLRFLLDNSNDEAAALAGIAPPAMRQRISRALKRLRTSPHIAYLVGVLDLAEG